MAGELKKIRQVFLDMDGTIYLDEQLFDGTMDFLSHVKQSGGRRKPDSSLDA